MKEKIENEIAERVIRIVIEKKEKVSNPELSKLIEAEIKNKDYLGSQNRLKRGWQTYYAVRRIQEKIKRKIKRFNSNIPKNPTETAKRWAEHTIVGLAGLIIMADIKFFLFLLPFILLIGGAVFLIVRFVETRKQKRMKDSK